MAYKLNYTGEELEKALRKAEGSIQYSTVEEIEYDGSVDGQPVAQLRQEVANLRQIVANQRTNMSYYTTVKEV